jgi:hypothetical protein
MTRSMYKKLENDKGKVENVTHLKRRVLECCVAILGQLNPLNLLQTCKKPASYACWKIYTQPTM